jgi:4-hydroxy-4-methyl-2-oxoglutarate aldolase
MTIAVAGVTVAPGDWVVGDVDGVVVVPGGSLEEVMAAGRRRAASETDTFAALREGATTVGLFHLDPTLIEDGDPPG